MPVDASLEAILKELKQDYGSVWYFAADECYTAVKHAIEGVPKHEETFVLYRLSSIMTAGG